MARKNHPTEGVTRCYCGVKYWDMQTRWHQNGDAVELYSEIIYVCHGCGEKYKPEMDDERIQAEREDRAALQFLTNMIVGGNG